MYMVGSVSAHPTVQFAKDKGLDAATDSWSLAYSGTSWQLSFTGDTTIVTGTLPPEPGVPGDFVTVPTLTITDLVDHGAYFVATFVPTGELTISSGGAAVFRASLGSGMGIIAETNWLAYQGPADDLNVVNHDASYSEVLHAMAVYDGQDTYILDLNIVGTSEDNLYQTLKNVDGMASGDLAGTIHTAPTPIPVPGAMLLSSLGTALIGWIRGRRWL
jgi:hypothetical protein